MRLRAEAIRILTAMLFIVPGHTWAQSAIVTFTPVTITGGRNATGLITLSTAAPSDGLIVRLSSGNSAASVPENVLVPGGQSSAGFSVTTTPVAQSTTVVVSFVAGNYSSTARLAVVPPVPVSITMPQTVRSGDRLRGEVVLNGDVPDGGLMVPLSSTNPMVASVPATVLIGVGKKEQTRQGEFDVTVRPVAQSSGVTITAGTGTASVNALLTVLAPTVGRLDLIPDSVYGGVSTRAYVGLVGTAPAGFVIQLASSNPGVAVVPANAVLPADAGSIQIAISTVPVAQTANVQISARTGDQVVQDNLKVMSPVPASLTVSPTGVVGGHPVNAQVTLTGSAPPGGVPVSISVDGPSNVDHPAIALVAAGQTTKNFVIGTPPVGGPVVAQVRAAVTDTHTGVAVTRSVPLSIRPIPVSALTLSLTNVSGLTGTLTGRVVLEDPAAPGNVNVQITSSHSAFVNVPSGITIPAGEPTSANFTIAYANPGTRTTVTITATAGGVSKSAQFVINP